MKTKLLCLENWARSYTDLVKFIPENAFSVKNRTVDIMHMYLDWHAVRMVAGGGGRFLPHGGGSTLWPARHGRSAAPGPAWTFLWLWCLHAASQPGSPSCGAISHRVLDILCARRSLRLDCLLPLGKRPPRRPLCCGAVCRCLDRRKCPFPCPSGHLVLLSELNSSLIPQARLGCLLGV